MLDSTNYISTVSVSDGIVEQIAKFQKEKGRKVRTSYIGGPGDIGGTYDQWRQGQHDQRVPIVTYSAMFYELTEKLDLDAQVLIQNSVPDGGTGRFKFESISREKFSGGYLQWLRHERTYASALVEAVNRYDPDIIIVSSDAPSFSWRRLSRGRRLVLSAHNTFWPSGQKPRGIKDRLRFQFLSWRAKHLDGTVCVSHECSRQVKKLAGNDHKTRIAYPQILSRYTPSKSDRIASLLFLGRIEKFKGIFELLDAYQELKKDFPELTLSYAGTGKAADELVSRTQATDGVEYHGRLRSAEVHEAIRNADLVICPTTTKFNEGLAVVGFEAAAHGVPVALSSMVPAKDLLANGCIVFAPDSTEAISTAIRRLINNPEDYRSLKYETLKNREIVYDRTRSWGSQLSLLLEDLNGPN